MEPFKVKVMHVEDDITTLSPIRHNRNYYHRSDNNGDNESSTVILDGGHLGDTFIPKNTDPTKNNIPPWWYKIQDLLKQNRYHHKYYHS